MSRRPTKSNGLEATSATRAIVEGNIMILAITAIVATFLFPYFWVVCPEKPNVIAPKR